MVSYSDISREVGFEGFRTYPTKDHAKTLLWELEIRPNLDDFKEVLSLYRFLPEAKDIEEVEIMCILNDALAVGNEKLFEAPVQPQSTTFSQLQWFTNPYKALRAIIG